MGDPMKKTAAVFYFTGTGNTRYISDHLTEGLERLGWEATSFSITGLDSAERDRTIENSDVMVLAYPIYGSDMPENMRRFIEELPERNGKQLAVVCSQMLFSGDGASILFRKLKNNGYRQRWAYQVNMPNNLCIKGSPLSQSSDYDKHEKKHLTRARTKVAKIAERIDSGKTRIGDHSPVHLLLGWTQRPAFRHFARPSYKKALSVDSVKCIGCGKCVRSCPEGVLEMEGSKAVFLHQEKCLSCLRCMNFCPVPAITFNGAVKEPLYKGPTREIFKELFK
jgi:ferredoxin/flavodoxin